MKILSLISSVLGLQKKNIHSLVNIKKYLSDRKMFQDMGGNITSNYPILTDFDDAAGSTKSQYFIHDLLIARRVFLANPDSHFDVASRVDGLVAHIASFRDVTILDVRPLSIESFPQIKYIQADLMSPNFKLDSVCDSISCLSALEHFGLGRYNDPVNPDGHLIGFNNLIKMLKPGGILYLSFPICTADTAVCFNAHRVLNYKEILTWLAGHADIVLDQFDYIDDSGLLHVSIDINDTIKSDINFGCAIYTLRKINQ